MISLSLSRSGVSVALLVGVVAGCAPSRAPAARPLPLTLSESSPFHIGSLARGDAWLRHYLIQREPLGALELYESPADRPTSDALLQSLQQAILYREAADFAKSNSLLEWAGQETERRRVRSATRTAASFLINDRVLGYTPTPTEALMIPYYRMMNYLDLGKVDEAAVEARRISARLAEGAATDLRRCHGDGMLNYLAGLVFEAAGEMNDALVSLRRAEEDFGACEASEEAETALPVGFGRDLYRIARGAGVREVADSALVRHPGADRLLPADSAEVLVVLERGFVAHRTEETIHVPIFEEEIEGLESDDEEGIASVTAAVVARLADNFAQRQRWGYAWDDDPGVQLAQSLSGAYVLRLGWPAVVTPPVHGVEWSDFTSPGTRSPVVVADLSTLALAEFEAERLGILARLVTRAVTKYLVTREVERKAEKQGGELLGFLAGRLMNYAANEMERADTRSWTLLPREIAIARRVVAAGEVGDGVLQFGERVDLATGPAEDESPRRLILRPRERKVMSLRLFDGAPTAAAFDQTPEIEASEEVQPQ